MKKGFAQLFVVLVIASIMLAACGPADTAQTPGAPTTPAEAPGDLPGETPMDTPGDTGGEATPTGDTAGEATPAGGTTPGQLSADCGNVELTYWNPFTGPDGPFMGEMVEAFNQAHENINVTMNSQGDYYTQLTTAAASGTLPDVAIVHADQVATQAFRNVLAPIDDLVAEVGVTADEFPEAVWAAGDVNGTRYSIPLDIHPMTMFYNADLLRENGYEQAPTTREEFEEMAGTMTDGNNFGFMITTGFPVAQIFQQLLHQFGGTEFNADGTEATWNSEAGVQALEWMRDAQQQYSEQNLEVDAELNAFKAGYVGMVWNGIWQTTNLTGDAVAFEGVATSVPQIGPEPAVWAGSHQFTIPVQAGGQDACKRQASGIFIRYMLDNSVTWARAGQIPANNQVRESAEFQDVSPQAQIAPSVENAIFLPAVPGIADATGPMGEAVAAVMSGEATDIQATLDASVERANQILQENRNTYGDAPAPAP